MSGRFLVRAKNAWRKMWNLYERPSPYDDAPPKSSEMRYPSPANHPPPDISTEFPTKTERLAHQYVFEREQRGTWTEEAPKQVGPPSSSSSTTPSPSIPSSSTTAVATTTGPSGQVAVPGSRPYAHLKPIDLNKDPKLHLHEYWRKLNEFYGMDMRNLRNWERYPEKIFTEEGKGKIENFPKIDAIRVNQAPWYGY